MNGEVEKEIIKIIKATVFQCATREINFGRLLVSSRQNL